MSEEFYPEHEIHTDPVENQQTEQQTWQAAQQQTAQQTWQAAPQQPSSPAPEAKKKGGKAAKVVALLLACALVGGGSGFGAAALMQKQSAPASNSVSSASSDASVMLEGQRQTAALQVASIDTSKVLTPSEVYAQNVNSTVGITTSITTNYFGYQTTGAAAGSGFILTADGYILTNYHVVESSDSIKVTTYDGTSYDAQLIGYDESNDIAVLKIDATDLTPVVLGDSDTLNVGDSVVAIGNPLGELTFSLTTGVVSALDRPVTFSTGSTMNLIQTDCAINSGNSGGALFNLYGEVIGITNAKYSSSSASSEASIDNIGFAIPIDQVRSIFESIITNGYIVKPYIGVTVSDVSAESQSYGLPQGAAVRSVTENGPAAEAGLQENDIITTVNGEAITGSNDQVLSALEDYAGRNETFDEGLDQLKTVVKYLSAFGVPEENFAVDLTIARGLDYYTGTVYETALLDHPEIGSVCSGGRYDNLAEYYTDKQLPGVGISIGLTRLFYVLGEQGMLNGDLPTAPADVLILPMTEDLSAAVTLATKLRDAGVRTQLYTEQKKFKAKMNYADKTGVPYVVFLGEDEVKNNVIACKDMTSGEQTTLDFAATLARVRDRLAERNKGRVIVEK